MTPALDAATDFARLREPTWARFHRRHPVYPRERFEDAYSEWWTRELARGADGRPSRPVAPVAFIAEAVHRVLIDEGRALARGLARGDEKHELAVIGFDDLDADPAGDTGGEARYRLLVHRIIDLVGSRLTSREMSVFVASYLYLQPTSVAAAGLGLSVPRVKKDRQKIAAKVGEDVWAILGAELDLCEAYDDRRLPAVLELLTVHVDGCPHCREQLQAVRGSAHAIAGPVELLVVGGAVGGSGGGDVLDWLWARFGGWGHRAAEVAASMPPSGRTAAVVGVAAATLGGTVAVERTRPDRAPAAVERSATPTPTPRRAPARRTPTATPPAAAAPAAPTAAPTAAPRRTPRPRRRATPAPTPAATGAPVTPAPPSSGGSGGPEFGFEAG